MPFEIMDQRGVTTSSHLFEDIRFLAERQIGFCKTHSVPDHQIGLDVVGPIPHLDTLSSTMSQSVDSVDPPQSVLAGIKKGKLPTGEGGANMSKKSSGSIGHHLKSSSSLSVQPAACDFGRSMSSYSKTPWESGLFSSSLSKIFSRKLGLLENDVQSHRHTKIIAPSHKEEEPFESLEENEAQTIRNLLPEEDDLLSGVTDGLGNNSHTYIGDDSEDFDLFSSSGGMELEGDDHINVCQGNSVAIGRVGQGGFNGLLHGKHPYSEHPSKTVLFRDVNSNAEDFELKALLEQYGDTRASQNALRAHQNEMLRRSKIDAPYSFSKDDTSGKDANKGTLIISNLDPSVSADELHHIFGVYGEIKEIRDGPNKFHQKYIEYYNVGAAEAAISALNRSDLAGKRIKIELFHPYGARSMIRHEEPNLFQSTFDDKRMVSPEVIASGSLENGSAQILHPGIKSPVGAFIEPHWSSSVPSNLPSPARAASVGKQFGLHEPNHTLDEINFGNQCFPSFHPHSLPEYHDGLTNGTLYKSSSTAGGMASSVGSNVSEGIDIRHIRGAGSSGHMMEFNGGVFGSSGNGSCTLPGTKYIWKNANSGQQHPSSHMIWPNSPSYVNGIHSHHLSHMSGFPRGSPVMLNMASSQHHVGSAPAVDPSLWDRSYGYSGESPEASSFHLGSLGSVNFPGTSPSHPMEVTPHTTFSHVRGSCMDISKNAGLHASQQIRHIFAGQNPMLSNPVPFDSSNERVRNFCHRRIESNANHSDKKQFELDIDHIIRGEDSRTTLMIKNIPNKYTSKMLLAAIDEHCRGSYDFLYLPIDFKNKCNVGYAFVNIIDPQQIIPFHKAFNGKKWEKFNSEKVASLAYARIQGKAALVAHFQNSSLMNEDKRCRPILFHTDGPNAGDPV
uniref:Uncharacterized protein MANES_06G126700 n=1 Tax=Rhizophora mucronata TaxID=61149 RepID=A0A2P2M990_RHIMU